MHKDVIYKYKKEENRQNDENYKEWPSKKIQIIQFDKRKGGQHDYTLSSRHESGSWTDSDDFKKIFSIKPD